MKKFVLAPDSFKENMTAKVSMRCYAKRYKKGF